MKKYFPGTIFLFFISLFLAGCSTFFSDSKPEFVKVRGGQFYIGEKPYYYMGTNLWYGCYLGSIGETGDRERLINELDLLKSLGITNLRVLAASEQSAIKNSLKPSIQKAPGIYDEDLLEGLDFLLNEMDKRGMYAVIFLNNYWEWSGGMSQYNAWFNDSTNGTGRATDPEVDGWGNFMKASATFYFNEKANRHFREFIKQIVNRKNKFSGSYYYEDPAIMSWQLANEPRPGSNEDVQYYYNWVDSTAMYIHSIDPNHLVTTGNEGLMGSLGSEDYYLTAHKSKYIDYMTFHLWIKNWGWFDAKKTDETYPSAKEKAADYINKHINYARQLNKPLALEEFGIARDSELYAPGTSTKTRDDYYSMVFGIIYDSASAGAPIAGSNFWTWGGYGRARHDDFKWQKGDPFMGDPPQEPQGLNSIFDVDASSVGIIKTYADKMKSLSDKVSLINKQLTLIKK